MEKMYCKDLIMLELHFRAFLKKSSLFAHFAQYRILRKSMIKNIKIDKDAIKNI